MPVEPRCACSRLSRAATSACTAERPCISDHDTRDDASQTFHPGDTIGETGKTVHWHRNDGKDAVILITADILSPPTSVPIPKFAHPRGPLRCELRR